MQTINENCIKIIASEYIIMSDILSVLVYDFNHRTKFFTHLFRGYEWMKSV